MASVNADHHKEGMAIHDWVWFKACTGKLMGKVAEFASKTKKFEQDDPRRIIHSLKVGLAITLISLVYYFDPLYDGFGVSAMWAVLTVVVVFEFSVGATLSKGLNRGLATFLAGTLGFGAHHLAILSGEKVEPILLGLFVFLLAAVMTFVRFFPRMKAKYDYGLLVFILTFCLISVSGYRDDEVLDMAHKRVSTILLGGFTALIVCIFICPVWAGEDLHKLVANNIEMLACFLEGFGPEYFKTSDDLESNKTHLEGYKSVLHSKQTEESLTPQEIREKIQVASMKVSSESVKALKGLAMSIKTMTAPCSATQHITKSKIAAKNLKSVLNTDLWKATDLLEVIPAAIMASLLVDVVSCSENIAESVHELASLAKFKRVKPEVAPKKPEVAPSRKPSLRKMQSCSNSSTVPQSHHVITIE